MNLIQLVDALSVIEMAPDTNLRVAAIPFYMEPDSLSSYRGDYEDLAIVCTPRGGRLSTAAELRKALEGAIGKVFHGYKGGEFMMHTRTRLWLVADHSQTGACVTGLVSAYRGCVALTWEEDE